MGLWVSEEFEQICGQIIRRGLSAEDTLSFVIQNYFVWPQTRKTFLLGKSVLDKLSFSNKIRLLNNIMGEEQIERMLRKKIIKNLDKIREIRNTIAHSEAYLKEGEMSLTRMCYSRDKKTNLKIDQKLLTDFKEMAITTVQELHKLHFQFSPQKNELIL